MTLSSKSLWRDDRRSLTSPALNSVTTCLWVWVWDQGSRALVGGVLMEGDAAFDLSSKALARTDHVGSEEIAEAGPSCVWERR